MPVPVFVTSDAGTNIRKAIELGREFQGITCIAHKFHRVVLCAVDTLPPLVEILKRVLNISRNFNKSEK